MTTRSISLPDALDARLRRMSRDELPNVSQLIAQLLVKELDRRDAARARKQTTV